MHPMNALTPQKIRSLKKPGRYADGNGLYLQVDPSGAKRWVLRTRVRGKRCDIGLGGLRLVTLAEAREEARRLRKIARQGGDPFEERRKAQREVITFEMAAQRVHGLHAPTWRNPKHAAQWITSLQQYVFPIIGAKPVEQISSGDVLSVLAPIWTSKPETARRIKQRIRVVMDWCRAVGRCTTNPVDGVTRALPKIPTTKKHHAALPYQQIPDFLRRLRTTSALVTRLALEYLILTAARTGEVLLARWSEIDFDTQCWTIPAERMKSRRAHRVPLSSRCVEILREAARWNEHEYIFPGRPGKPISNMTLLMLLRRMGLGSVTVHGFRSSFRDWAEEQGCFARSVIEAALAHAVADKTEAAYLRSDLFDARRNLMQRWADFGLAKCSSNIT